MVYEARRRAKRRGQPCTITTADFDIPEHCPVLGTKLQHKYGTPGPAHDSPSLDCIIPSLGYTPGNVVVLSHRANSMKSDANLEELRRLVRFLERVLLSPATVTDPKE